MAVQLRRYRRRWRVERLFAWLHMTCPPKTSPCEMELLHDPPRVRGGVVRKSRFNEEQIISILKESVSGVEAGELCRRHGITRGSLHRWKAKYGGMEVSEARRQPFPH
jgi:hypothetical protein